MKHLFNLLFLFTFIAVIFTSCDDTIVGDQIDSRIQCKLFKTYTTDFK